ncbi:MAG: hypothetical protein M1497_02300, partial [Nitrospirae bacterium]|nr:hypothetical protein [Nitrospirota bacterium]
MCAGRPKKRSSLTTGITLSLNVITSRLFITWISSSLTLMLSSIVLIGMAYTSCPASTISAGIIARLRGSLMVN